MGLRLLGMRSRLGKVGIPWPKAARNRHLGERRRHVRARLEQKIWGRSREEAECL